MVTFAVPVRSDPAALGTSLAPARVVVNGLPPSPLTPSVWPASASFAAPNTTRGSRQIPNSSRRLMPIPPARIGLPGSYRPTASGYTGRLELDQALPHRVQHRLRAVVDAQLLVHVADVVPHRLFADLQPVRDLLVGHAVRQQLQDLDLAVREPVVELLRRRGAGEHVEDAVRHRARHDPFAGHD